MEMDFAATGHEDRWKVGWEATDDDDDADFYFTTPPEFKPPPPSRAVGFNAPLHTPDTSFHQFDDSISLDTTPKVGRSTRKAAVLDQPAADLRSFEHMFEPSFPSEEFLSVVTQQIQQHSFSSDTGGGQPKKRVEGDGFESPSLESLTLNPFPAGLAQEGDSLTTASHSLSYASARDTSRYDLGAETSPQKGSNPSGSPSALSDRDGVTESFYQSPLRSWTEMTKRVLANVMASEAARDTGDGKQATHLQGDDLKPKFSPSKFEATFTPDRKPSQAVTDQTDLFSRDLIATEFDPEHVLQEKSGNAPETPSSHSKTVSSGFNSLLAVGDDGIPRLESSFLSHESSESASRPNQNRAGQLLSHVVGRCYACDEGEVSIPNDPALLRQWQGAKEKSLSMFQNAAQFLRTFLEEKPFASASNRDDGRFSTARRHRRFPSASTFDYSESQNLASGEMSHYTASEGDGTSFDDDDYDDGDDDDEDGEDEDDRTRSTARGGGSSVGTGREEAAASPAPRSEDLYAPRVGGSHQAAAAAAAASSAVGRRHGGRPHSKTSLAGESPSLSPSLWMPDPLAKVNEGVQKLFGDASAVLALPSGKSPDRTAAAASGQPKKTKQEQLARATDRFAC